MNWPFLFLALLGGALPLGMIAWILLLAPTGDTVDDRERERRRAALGARLRSLREVVAGAVRPLARGRALRKVP